MENMPKQLIFYHIAKRFKIQFLFKKKIILGRFITLWKL